VRGRSAVRPAAGRAATRVAGGLAVGLALVLAGCGADSGARQAAPAAVDGASSATPTADALPAPSEEPAADPSAAVAEEDRGATAPDAVSVPPTTAGELDSRDVPAPPDLGPGWTRYVDPGGAEEGYAGNGSWVRARDSAEVARALLPIGCSGRLPRLPVPKHALEATYRGPGGAPAAALVLSFRDDRVAKTFLAGVASLGAACPAAEGVSAGDPMVTVVTVARVTDTSVLDRRRELGVGAGPWVWSEAVVRRGARVGLLAVASEKGRGDLPALEPLRQAVRGSVAG
jgi:hypothetical protein